TAQHGSADDQQREHRRDLCPTRRDHLHVPAPDQPVDQVSTQEDRDDDSCYIIKSHADSSSVRAPSRPSSDSTASSGPNNRSHAVANPTTRAARPTSIATNATSSMANLRQLRTVFGMTVRRLRPIRLPFIRYPCGRTAQPLLQR